MVWTRDRASDHALRTLLGQAYDPVRHRCGVDLAFGLPAVAPRTPLPEQIQQWLDEPWVPLVALNVSALVLAGRRRFGLRADYRAVVTELMRRLLQRTACRVMLVPHVFTAPGHHEHDPDACRKIAGLAGSNDRVAIVPQGLDSSETKWLISHADWLCSTRMHAAIAALSTGVPAAALAYSDKTRGVFDTCGLGWHVADLRRERGRDIVEHLWRSFQCRAGTEAALARRLPAVMSQAECQMDAIIEFCMQQTGAS
jgi:polysaccharide pyruvyl transferase WcaK-like protein